MQTVIYEALQKGISKAFKLPVVGGQAQIWYKIIDCRMPYKLKQLDFCVDAAVRLVAMLTKTYQSQKEIDAPH